MHAVVLLFAYLIIGSPPLMHDLQYVNRDHTIYHYSQKADSANITYGYIYVYCLHLGLYHLMEVVQKCFNDKY